VAWRNIKITALFYGKAYPVLFHDSSLPSGTVMPLHFVA
jgi:hypothetical protein